MSKPLIAGIEYNHDCICSDVPERFPDTSIRYLAELGEDRKAISHLFQISGSDVKIFIDSIRSHHTTYGVKVIQKSERSALVIPRTGRDVSTKLALKESGCSFVSNPIYYSAVEKVNVFAPSFENLRSFLDHLKYSYNVKVVSKRFLKDDESVRFENLERSGYLELSTAASRLTKKQAKVLKLAAEGDYYAIPRGTSLSDIAAQLDVSEAAASELLRKAERKLLPSLAKIIDIHS